MAAFKYNEGLAKLQSLEILIRKLEREKYDRGTVLELTRIVYWLMERWVREHDQTAK